MMIDPHAVNFKTVEDVWYQADQLKIRCEDGTTLAVSNGGFTLDNPALQVLAYLGLKPSDLDDYDGESVIMVVNGSVAQQVFGNGKNVLEQAEWGPAPVSKVAKQE